MSRDAFEVRAATWQHDEDALRRVRFAVFVGEQAVPAEIEVDALDEACEHALAVDAAGRPIGTARLDLTGGDGRTGHIGRVAVLPPWRRRGVGEALMRHMIERAAQLGARHIEISAQLQALAFYEALGFVARGEVYVEAGIDHRAMRLDLTG